MLPLGIGSTVLASNPFFITFLAFLFLGDRVTLCELSAIVVSFSGIALMAMSNPNSKQDDLDVEGALQKGAHD
jgi:drug/metabolite transporter (DMT)-like permease